MFRATSRRGALRKTRTAVEEEEEDAERTVESFSKRRRGLGARKAAVQAEHEAVEGGQEKESTAANLEELQGVSKDTVDAKEIQKEDADGLYHGMAKYKDYRAGFRREDTAKAANKYGPKRAPDNVRRTVLVDYQPDICKDYKETGYCGYGDSCKFLHDRGDYKLGWQLDRDWEEKMKRERELAEVSEDEDQEEEEEPLPFACLMCRTPWKDFGSSLGDPVVTRCGHFFCEHCALKHNATSKKCFVCNQPTSGVFNTAFEVLKKYKG